MFQQVKLIQTKVANARGDLFSDADILNILAKPNTIAFVDIDGTLIQSDLANNLAYKQAITLAWGGHNLDIPSDIRITLASLKILFPNLTQEQIDTIKKIKDEIYPDYLKYTNINTKIFEILDTLHSVYNNEFLANDYHPKIRNLSTKTLEDFYKKIIIVTNASQQRAKTLLEYYTKEDRLGVCGRYKPNKHTFYSNCSNGNNKYLNAMKHFGIDIDSVSLIFEDDSNEIQEAIDCGFPEEKIIQIKNGGVK